MTIRSYIDRYQVNKGDGAYLGKKYILYKMP